MAFELPGLVSPTQFGIILFAGAVLAGVFAMYMAGAFASGHEGYTDKYKSIPSSYDIAREAERSKKTE